MPVTGDKIFAADYDALALKVNRIFSDTSNGSGGPANLVYETSDRLANVVVTASQANGGLPITLNSDITESESYIIVDVLPGADVANDRYTLQPADYTVDYDNNTVTLNALAGILSGDLVRVYNRYRHIYGWGQEPASVYPHPTYPTDSIELSRVLEANTNNLIDKVNIMTERIGSDVELTRIAKGDKIFPNFSKVKDDFVTIESVIDTQVVSSAFNNVIANMNEGAETQERTATWEDQLVVGWAWAFTSYNEARYFFNAGGEVRTGISAFGPTADAGYRNWVQVFNQMGSIALNWNTTFQTGTGGTSSNIGFYDLTEDWQQIFITSGPARGWKADGEYGEYPVEVDPAENEYLDLVVKIDARYRTNGPDHIVDLRLTLNNRPMSDVFGADVNIEGATITFNGGYKGAADVTNNSASYVMTLPTIGIFNTPNSGDDF